MNKEQQGKSLLDVRFEKSLIENESRLETMASVVSTVYNALNDVYEAWEFAENGDKKIEARYAVVAKVAELMPVLEMLQDYANDCQARAKQIQIYKDVLSGQREEDATHARQSA